MQSDPQQLAKTNSARSRKSRPKSGPGGSEKDASSSGRGHGGVEEHNTEDRFIVFTDMPLMEIDAELPTAARVAPLSLSVTQHIPARNPEQLTVTQTQPEAPEYGMQALTTTDTVSSQRSLTLTPLSSSPNLARNLVVVPHLNPLRDRRMGEQPSLPQPLPQISVPRRLPVTTPCTSDFTDSTPALDQRTARSDCHPPPSIRSPGAAIHHLAYRW